MTSPHEREWVIHDTEALRQALMALQRKRKLTLEDLFHRMGGRLLNKFFRGEQSNLHTSTLFKARDAMSFEIVIREPRTSKTQQRLDKLRAEQEARQAGLLKEAAEEAVAAKTGQDPLTPELRAEVSKMLDQFHDPHKLLNPRT